MSEKHMVCQGAICECEHGDTPDTLQVLTHKKHYINDSQASSKLVATHVDTGETFKKNTFGQCKLQPTVFGYKTCKPQLEEWKGFYEKITYSNNGKPLLENSMGVCAISGSPCIKITFHGQTAEPSQQNASNANPEAIAQLFPFVNLTHANNENEQILEP